MIIIRFILVAIFLSACSNQVVLNLKPYSPNVIKNTYPKKYVLEQVVDLRSKKDIIAIINDSNSNTKEALISNENIPNLIYNSLKNGLEKNGNLILDAPSKTSVAIKIILLDFLSVYNGKFTDKDNLKGNLDIRLEITKGTKTIIKNIKQSQSKWVAFMNASDFEPFLQDLLNDVIARSIYEIEHLDSIKNK